MAITIKQDNGGVWVNNTFVYPDASGNWIADSELTTSEKQAFNAFIKTH